MIKKTNKKFIDNIEEIKNDVVKSQEQSTYESKSEKVIQESNVKGHEIVNSRKIITSKSGHIRKPASESYFSDEYDNIDKELVEKDSNKTLDFEEENISVPKKKSRFKRKFKKVEFVDEDISDTDECDKNEETTSPIQKKSESLSDMLKDVDDDSEDKIEDLNDSNNFIDDLDSESEDDESEEDVRLLKSAKKNKTKFRLDRPEFTEETIEYISGFPVAPISIDSYDSEKITENEAHIIRKLGINSITIVEGDPIPVKVFGTKNSTAMLISDDDKSYLKWIGDFIKLENKSKSTNGKVFVDVIVTDDLNTKRITQPVSVLTDKSKVKTLSNFDIHISSFDSITVAIALKKVLEKMSVNDKNKELGVIAFPGSEIGFAFNGYNTADAFEVQNNCMDYDDYLEKFNALLEPSVPLQFLISATMGATILTILQEVYNYDLHSYCINIVGGSSTGKTISSQVAASMWTNPTSDKIFSAMLSTTNAALKRLSGRNGVPTFVDEASAVIGNIKAEEYAYQVYEQCEKHRLNSDCSEKESGKWSTVVVMTSEQRFAASAKNQNGGLAVRIHVIDNQMWTVDKSHAEKLQKFIRNNYGVVGKAFTDCLFLENMFEELPERYEEACEVITKFCYKNKSDFTDRLCQTYAVTLMTAQILKEEIGLDIDIKGVAKILMNHNRYVAKEQNLALNAYRAIISYITRNPGRPGIRKDVVGKKVERYIIEESLMADILSKAGFQDSNVTLKALDDAGFLLRQGVNQKGLKSKLTVDGVLCRCYQIDATIMENN